MQLFMYISICPFSSHICILCTCLSVHQVINRSLGSIIPRNVQKAVLEGLFSIGRAQVSDYILNEKNPIGSLRLARLRSILDEGKSLQLQFPAEDLGFWLVPLQLITSKESVVSFLSSVAGTTKQGRNILRPWRYANFLVMILFVCLQLWRRSTSCWRLQSEDSERSKTRAFWEDIKRVHPIR